MALNPQELMSTAKLLLASGGQVGVPSSCKEALERAAISRGYYACFLQARAIARAIDPSFATHSKESHQVVWEWWEDYGEPKIYAMGEAARIQRNKADYDIDLPPPHTTSVMGNLYELLKEILRAGNDWATTKNPTLPL